MSDDTKKVGVVYRPGVLEVSDVGAAKAIILTPQRGTTAAERTPELAATTYTMRLRKHG